NRLHSSTELFEGDKNVRPPAKRTSRRVTGGVGNRPPAVAGQRKSDDPRPRRSRCGAAPDAVAEGRKEVHIRLTQGQGRPPRLVRRAPPAGDLSLVLRARRVW